MITYVNTLFLIKSKLINIKENTMNEKARQALQALLFTQLGRYIEMSNYCLQKNIMSQKRPKQWMIDQASTDIMSNIVQFSTQASNPLPASNGGGLLDIFKALGITGDDNAKATDPNNITLPTASTFKDKKGKYNVIDGKKHYLA